MAISRRIGIIGLVLLLIGGPAAPAEAHTTLVSSDPAKAATVAPITQVTLTYADPVIVPRVVVRDAQGTDHVAKVHATANRVVAHLTALLSPGAYTVGWRVVAPDGHPVTGEYKFTIKTTASTPLTARTPGSAPTHVSPTPISYDSDSSFSWGWLFLIVVAVAAVGGVVALLIRRRSSTSR
jgi:copper resistance protein C